MVKPWDETMKQLIDASPQQSAYGRRNRAEQAWLERVIQDMYDIIEQTPLYQSWTRRARQEGREEGLKEGLEEGLKEGKLEGMHQTLVTIVRVRFPRLVSLAKTRAAQIDDPKVLEDLMSKVSTAQHAKEVRRYLQPPEEGQPH
jgi:flagellar biosynthesis/type III secretory pathway protein FliH